MALVSGSRLERAILCAGSAVFPQVDEAGEAAEAGSAKHVFLRAVRSGVPRAEALALVPAEHRKACDEIDLEKLPRRGPGRWFGELALAYDYASGKARVIGEDRGRDYGELGPTEIPMALDELGLLDDGSVEVIDWKSGWSSLAAPAQNWQLKLMALAAARAFGRDRATVRLSHVRDNEEPWTESATLDEMDLDAAAADVRRAMVRLEAARELVQAGGTPHLSMGSWCGYCAARRGCPARLALLRTVVESPDEVRKRFFAEMKAGNLEAAYRLKAELGSLLKDLTAALVTQSYETPVDLGGGKWYGPHPGRRSVTDAGKARDLLLESFGPEVANAACSVEYHATVGGIDDALKGAGLKKKERDRILEDLLERGAVTQGIAVSEHVVKDDSKEAA